MSKVATKYLPHCRVQNIFQGDIITVSSAVGAYVHKTRKHVACKDREYNVHIPGHINSWVQNHWRKRKRKKKKRGLGKDSLKGAFHWLANGEFMSFADHC